MSGKGGGKKAATKGSQGSNKKSAPAPAKKSSTKKEAPVKVDPVAALEAQVKALQARLEIYENGIPAGFAPEELAVVARVISKVEANKSLLDSDELAFLKNFVSDSAPSEEELPELVADKHEEARPAPKSPPKYNAPPQAEPPKQPEPSPVAPEHSESDSDEEDSNIVEGDSFDEKSLIVKLRADGEEPSEEAEDKASDHIQKAKKLETSGDLQKAFEEALSTNPNYAKAFKLRGRAEKLLGKWAAAFKDLSAANQCDYDPEVYEELKGLQGRVDKLNAREARRRVKAEEARRAEQSKKPAAGGARPAGAGGFGIPGMPNLPPEMMAKLLGDPEIMAALQKPGVMEKLTAIMGDPSKIKDVKDPELMSLITKLSAMFPGAAGAGATGGHGHSHDHHGHAHDHHGHDHHGHSHGHDDEDEEEEEDEPHMSHAGAHASASKPKYDFGDVD